MVYEFVANPHKIENGKQIATARNGEAYTKSNCLYIKSTTWHLIYKYNGSPVGWYARNVKTNVDVYLGNGASPSIVLERLVVQDESAWNALLQQTQI